MTFCNQPKIMIILPTFSKFSQHNPLFLQKIPMTFFSHRQQITDIFKLLPPLHHPHFLFITAKTAFHHCTFSSR